VTLVNSTKHTQKKREKTDRARFSRLFTTSGQEMERVYSFNLESTRGPSSGDKGTLKFNRSNIK